MFNYINNAIDGYETRKEATEPDYEILITQFGSDAFWSLLKKFM